jgi:cyclin-dependent kinase 2
MASKLGKKIGSGTYGDIYEITNDDSLVYKKFTDISDQEYSSSFVRELGLLRMLSNCENIVQLDSFDLTDYGLYLKKFKCNLLKVSEQNTLTEHEIKKIIFQVLMGIYQAYQCGVLNHDIKPDNILIRDSGHIAICDWGLGRFLPQYSILEDEIQTIWYRAPEILLGALKYDVKIEIWSVGAIFYELFLGKAVFQGGSEFGQLNKIFQILGTPTEQTWPGITCLPNYKEYKEYIETECLSPKTPTTPTSSKFSDIQISPDGLDLLTRMLISNPNERIGIRDALNHPYFDEFRKERRS